MSISKNKWFKFFLFEGSILTVVLLFLCLIVSSVLGYFIPEFLIQLSESYEKHENYYHVIKLFFWLYFFTYLNRTFYQLLINTYIKKMIDFVRQNIYSKWLCHYDLSTNKKADREYPQGEVIARIMSDTQALRELVTSGAFGILIDVVFVFSFLINFVAINKVTGIFLAITELLAAILLIKGGSYMREVFNLVRKAKGNVSRSVANVVGGLKESYFISHDQYASKSGIQFFNEFLKVQLTANNWDASYYSIAESLYPLLLALVVFIFPYSHITQAALILALVELIQRSINPIKSIAGKITNIQRAFAGITRMEEFLDDLKQGHSSKLNHSNESLELSELEVNIISYAYPEKEKLPNIQVKERVGFNLKQIEFLGKPGELIGIVGLSGSGKSTLLNIISGNIIPDEGFISFKSNNRVIQIPGNGLNDLISYREQVSIVSQDSHIFSECLGFNICMNDEITEEFQIFWSWIKTKITYLEKWGIGPLDPISPSLLSLGQKQLISAIRSCFLKRSVVLFDEISSALDSELEEALREVILLIQKNSLTLIVAHRLETILKADLILIMDEGKLIDTGRHEGLLESSHKYQEFIQHLTQH